MKTKEYEILKEKLPEQGLKFAFPFCQFVSIQLVRNEFRKRQD